MSDVDAASMLKEISCIDVMVHPPRARARDVARKSMNTVTHDDYVSSMQPLARGVVYEPAPLCADVVPMIRAFALLEEVRRQSVTLRRTSRVNFKSRIESAIISVPVIDVQLLLTTAFSRSSFPMDRSSVTDAVIVYDSFVLVDSSIRPDDGSRDNGSHTTTDDAMSTVECAISVMKATVCKGQCV